MDDVVHQNHQFLCPLRGIISSLQCAHKLLHHPPVDHRYPIILSPIHHQKELQHPVRQPYPSNHLLIQPCPLLIPFDIMYFIDKEGESFDIFGEFVLLEEHFEEGLAGELLLGGVEGGPDCGVDVLGKGEVVTRGVGVEEGEEGVPVLGEGEGGEKEGGALGEEGRGGEQLLE